MEKKNWAIVDDDLIFHLLTENYIEKRNVHKTLFFFKNGKEAIDHVREHINSSHNLPDIILLDIYMPVMDGWDFINEFLPLQEELPKDIIIYIVSSSMDKKDLKRADELSVIKGYVIKPVDEFKIDEIIDELEAA